MAYPPAQQGCSFKLILIVLFWPDKYNHDLQYASADSDAVDMTALGGNPQAFAAWQDMYHVQ